jgi:type IV pilus assembly protein PilQ
MKESNRKIFALTLLLGSVFLFSCAALEKPKDETVQPVTAQKHEPPVFVPIEKKNRKTAKEIKPEKEKPYVVSIQEVPLLSSVKPPEEKEILISLNFRRASLETVLSMLSDNGRNFRYMVHSSAKNTVVRGFIIENVTWKEALDVLLDIHNLKLIEEKNLLVIMSYDAYISDITKKTKVIQTEQAHATARSTLISSTLKSRQAKGEAQKAFRSFRLKYTDPVEVKEYLEQIFKSVKTTSGKEGEKKEQAVQTTPISFSIFPKSSILTAYGSPDQLKEVEARLKEIDTSQKQVFIEARIVEILRNYSRSLGIQWGGHHLILSDPKTAIVGGAGTGIVLDTGGTPTGNPAVDFGAKDKSGGDPVTVPGIALQLSNALGTAQLNVRLSALERSGKSKTLSNPKVSTVNGVKATIQTGREIPYQQQTGSTSGSTTVAFKNAVLSLEVTPFVTPDNQVSMKIVAKKDDADFQNQVLGVPSILTRKIETNVTVDNGGTAVLGGVFENTKLTEEQAVPGLSKLPFLGRLFKGTAEIDNEKELLIFVTPRVVEKQ